MGTDGEESRVTLVGIEKTTKDVEACIKKMFFGAIQT
jgi:hypothetical protein